MQMYRVRFARKLPDDMVEMGDCILCAANTDAARDMAAALLGFSATTTQFEVVRVKPSLYLISRREIKESLSATLATAVNANHASTATFPGVTENRVDEYWYSVEAQATIRAEDENEAIAKLARGLIMEMKGEKQKRSIRDLDIKCDRSDHRLPISRTEEMHFILIFEFFRGAMCEGNERSS